MKGLDVLSDGFFPGLTPLPLQHAHTSKMELAISSELETIIF